MTSLIYRNKKKVTGSQILQLQGIFEEYELIFGQELANNHSEVRRRVVMMQDPLVFGEVGSPLSDMFASLSQNFSIIHRIDSLTRCGTHFFMITPWQSKNVINIDFTLHYPDAKP